MGWVCGGVNAIAAICCMITVWFAANCWIAVATADGTVAVVGAYVCPIELTPVVAAAAVCVIVVAVSSVVCAAVVRIIVG